MEDNSNSLLIRKIKASIFRNHHGKIPVRVTFEKEPDVTAACWAEGEHEAKYFEKSGKPFAAGDKFFVDKPGTYTVFVKNKAGDTDTETITVKHALPFFAAPLFTALLLALVGCAALISISPVARKAVVPVSKPSPVPAVSSTAPDAPQKTAQLSVHDETVSAAIFQSGKKGSVGNWPMENVKSNTVIMQAKIYLDGKAIATSPALRPGQKIRNIVLQQSVAPGNHTGFAIINCYDLKTEDYICTSTIIKNFCVYVAK